MNMHCAENTVLMFDSTVCKDMIIRWAYIGQFTALAQGTSSLINMCCVKFTISKSITFFDNKIL